MTTLSSKAGDAQFAAAMGGRGFGPNGAGGQKPPAPSAVVYPALNDGEINLGTLDTGGSLGIDLPKLVNGRLLIQGSSGAGKSWTLRRLLEQTVGLIQQIVIDPEGEFSHFAEANGLVVIDAGRLDTYSLGVTARRAREMRLSLLLDVSDLDREEQMITVTAFICALIDAPREHWFPCMVAIDEAHLFAPFGGQASESTIIRKSSIAALTDLMSRGRKRGLVGVLATQRIARMAKSVISEAHNFLIGLNTLDLDIRRAAETIGWDARRAFDRLPMLEPGNFVSVGPAFNRSPAVALIGSVKTKQGGATPVIDTPLRVDHISAAAMLDLDALMRDTEADAQLLGVEKQFPGLKAVRSFLRDPAFGAAARIWTELVNISPEGAMVRDLHTALPITKESVTAALALLDSVAALELMGEADSMVVRLERGMRQ